MYLEDNTGRWFGPFCEAEKRFTFGCADEGVASSSHRLTTGGARSVPECGVAWLTNDRARVELHMPHH